MTSSYFIRRSRPSQYSGLLYPTAAEVAAVLHGKKQSDGSYSAAAPAGSTAAATSIRA